jgi:CheY-like chemotaxis protein
MPMRVLIVDDSAVIRESLRRLFNSEGFTVCDVAEDGAQAIEKAGQTHPDLIVLDYSMPVMNGIQAAEKLKRLMPRVLLILFTAHATSALEEEARAAGISAVVSKQKDPFVLITTADALLGARIRLKRVFQIAYTQPLLVTRAELLKRRGYEVASALGNDAAKRNLENGESYDLFIVGHAAPQEERAEMVRWLKERYPSAKVLALRPAYDPQLDVADFNVLENGPDDFLRAVATAIP